MPAPNLYDRDKPLVPTKVADSVPLNGFKRRDMSYARKLVTV